MLLWYDSIIMLSESYKDRIPTQKNKAAAKTVASMLFDIILSLILRYVNGYTAFLPAFGFGFLLMMACAIGKGMEYEAEKTHCRRYAFVG